MISTEFFVRTFPHIVLISIIYGCGVSIFNDTLKISRKNLITQNDQESWITRTCNMWNLVMCIFSGIGFYNTFPLLFLQKSNEHHLFLLLYVLSKPLEFIDTFFLIQKLKIVGTLHWTHHAITMLYVWLIAANNSSVPFNLYVMFCVLNYFVHTLMYGYYFLTDCVKLPKWVSVCVTMFQLTQFVCGILWTFIWRNETPRYIFIITCGMYSYYFFLFSKLFIFKYMTVIRCTFCKIKMIKEIKCKKCQQICCISCQNSQTCELCQIAESEY